MMRRRNWQWAYGVLYGARVERVQLCEFDMDDGDDDDDTDDDTNDNDNDYDNDDDADADERLPSPYPHVLFTSERHTRYFDGYPGFPPIDKRDTR